MLLILLTLACTSLARAEPLRLATWAESFSRRGPGLLLRDIGSGKDPQILAAVALIDSVAPDVLLLTEFDYDAEGRALAAFAAAFGERFPHHYAGRPNSGRASGADLDRNGALGEPRDAWGYGRFAGDGGLALLSRYPIRAEAIRELTGLPWAALPDAVFPQGPDGPFWPAEVEAAIPVSSRAHWIVPLVLPDGRGFDLLAFGATPPIYDGAEDANGLRNAAELSVWTAALDGGLAGLDWVPDARFAVIGNANLDPARGQGQRQAMAAMLRRPDLRDPLPGQPTAVWPDGPGGLRLSYILPSAAVTLRAAGIEEGENREALGPHRLVWVEVDVPP